MINFIKKEIKSFGYAFAGIGKLIASQNHAKIHIAATVVVIGSGFFLRYSNTEWAVLVLVIGAVIAAEAVNTAIEFLADEITTEYKELIKYAKNTAAGAVLILSIAAFVIACLIILPKLILLFSAD